jgi:TnpA family transposase
MRLPECTRALRLVVNMIVLWNTIYIQAALEQL